MVDDSERGLSSDDMQRQARAQAASGPVQSTNDEESTEAFQLEGEAAQPTSADDAQPSYSTPPPFLAEQLSPPRHTAEESAYSSAS